MSNICLNPCPSCGGEILLYSTSVANGYNCFARCQKCKEEFPMPEAQLKTHGARIYPASCRKAERLWNRRTATPGKAVPLHEGSEGWKRLIIQCDKSRLVVLLDDGCPDWEERVKDD